MRKLIIILSIISINIFGVTFPEKSKNIEDFVPKNWKIFENVKGDLNKDGIEDVVLIIEDTNLDNLKKNNSWGSDILNLNPRILLVLFKDKNGEYLLVGKNDDCFIESESNIECVGQFDPLGEKPIDIKNNILVITFNYLMSGAGAWETCYMKYTFRYQKSKFQLIGLTYYSTMRNPAKGTEYSLNLSTKKLKITKDIKIFDEIDMIPKISWKNLKINKEYYLENMGNKDYMELFK